MTGSTLTPQNVEFAVLQGKPRLGGLCRDCRLADTCTFPRDPSRPVRSCDEFDPMQAVPRGPSFSRTADPEPPAPGNPLMGLCRECLRRQTCRYPKPLGGVWHCDELE